MESTRPPRFLGNPCVHATLFDPGGPLTPRHDGVHDAAFRSENGVGSATLFPFEALSRGLHPPCVRFVTGLATRQRNTRFRAVASLSRDRTLTCGVPIESFRHVCRATWLPLSPSFAWRNFRRNVSATRVSACAAICSLGDTLDGGNLRIFPTGKAGPSTSLLGRAPPPSWWPLESRRYARGRARARSLRSPP